MDYLASLGKSQTAAVIRDADIGVANSNRDAGIQEAECQKVNSYHTSRVETKKAFYNDVEVHTNIHF